jgi:XRE family transcriptional regulator, aerobic/anaerobic benzoate catabolism transcriptional regulator
MAVKREAPAAATEGETRSPCAAEAHGPYLRLLGERVRNARARRGMTRKILARDSKVSERYLAQLESGQGNISIALLRQIAQAMSVPIADLVRDGKERPVELTLLLQRLERLTPVELGEALALLGQRFSRTAGEDRGRRIALVGLRGAGKTTLGRELARRLELPYVELAKEIERDSGMSLNEIFSLSGQAAYRRYERRALDRVLEDNPSAVIGTGGSLVSEPGTYELLLNSCFTIWVKASPEEHMNRVIAQGDMRPMAGNAEAMEDLRRILAGRHALYAKADGAVDTTGKSVGDSLDELLALVRREAAVLPAARVHASA